MPESLSSTDWRDRAYDDNFASTYNGLEARRRIDPSFTVEDAEGTLRHLYILDGNDQGARGPLQDAILEAQIAAHERFIDEWRKEGTGSALPPKEQA
jgi:hypothetical protein